MTREEAIDELSVIYERLSHTEDCANGVYSFADGDYLEAIDMAIEALQAEYEDYEHATLVDIKEPLKVLVVRCKDCKHRSDGGWCDVYIQPRIDTDFCNHGERQCNYFGERGEP